MAKGKIERRGGAREGAGAKRAPIVVDEASPLMRGLGQALRELGQPSVTEIVKLTGLSTGVVARAMKRGHTAVAIRSVERMLDAIGYTVIVVPKPSHG